MAGPTKETPVPVLHHRAALAASQPIAAPTLAVPDEHWNPTGTLAFRFRLNRTLRAGEAPGGSGETGVVELIDCPLFTVEAGNNARSALLTAQLKQVDGKTYPARLDLAFLEAGKWYHLALAWDTPRKLLRMHLNGVEQGDLFHNRPLAWNASAKQSGPIRMASSDEKPGADIADIMLFSHAISESEATNLLTDLDVSPLSGEGRTLFSGELDLSGIRRELLFAPEFREKLDVTLEPDLLKDGRRVHEPTTEWVLEGNGRAWTEGGKLWLEPVREDADSHLVLWHNRRYPGDLLIEYSIEPQDTNKGLSILFFGAHPKDAPTASIFDSELPAREGIFSNYTHREINSYHISIWASDPHRKLRRTSNLRKNSGFYLVASGDDRIGGSPQKSHRVRILKLGGSIWLETGGVLSLVFEDDGKTFGPIHHDGYLGLRIMSHSGQVGFSDLKVHRVWRKEQ